MSPRRALDPFAPAAANLEVRLRRIEAALRSGLVGAGGTPPPPTAVVEESTSGFLSMTTSPGTAAGPFTIPNPDALVLAFMLSDWTSFWSSGASDHNVGNEISLTDGASWSADANPSRQTGSSEAGENYARGTVLHTASGTPTGTDIHYRTRAYTTIDTGADDLRWPKHLYGYFRL